MGLFFGKHFIKNTHIGVGGCFSGLDCVLYEQEELSLTPQHSCKHTGMTVNEVLVMWLTHSLKAGIFWLDILIHLINLYHIEL